MIRIDVLPDDVLLETFDFCVDPLSERKRDIEAWQSLVHVCRRWRSVIFGSPRRLNLRLSCTPKTPARDTLDVWPALPLIIRGEMTSSSGADNIVVALGQTNRVCRVDLWDLADRDLEKALAAMQVPFPELTHLLLFSIGETPPIVPDSFLGGSAPHLRSFQLDGIPFPGLPKLLLSATHLLRLDLSNIPHSGYFSPEALAALLSVLSSLETLHPQFQSSQSRPDWESRRPPPSERSVVPALEHFDFIGVIKYLEDLVTFIDAPRLVDFSIIFFNQTDFYGPRLAQFIGRTPILADCDVYVDFYNTNAIVRLPSRRKESTSAIYISYGKPNRLLSSVAQVCNTCLPPLSMVEDLYIEHRYSQLVWKKDAIEDTLWLELLLPFPAVKNLYLSKEFAPGIAAALQEVVGTEVLPSLQNIFVKELEQSGPFRKNIGQFVTSRQHSGHRIAISIWEIDSGVGSHVDLDVDSDIESDAAS